jgi:Protein of unknown function (DUF2846)
MKIALVALLFAASALAQGPPAALPAACGPASVNFKVNLNADRHTRGQPEAGKALVYFIQDDGLAGEHQHYTMKIGLDGAWVGAYKNNSYIDVSIEPGEHHVCANVQSNSWFGQLVALAHFTAEPGKVYYFRTRFPAGIPGSADPLAHLNPIDSDEAKYLIVTYPRSVSTPKK